MSIIRTPLMGHQEKIVEFAMKNPYTGVFADYGTGKSLTGLAWANKMKFKKILIVSTKTAIQGTWAEEIRKHTDYKFLTLIGTVSQKLDALYYGLRLTQIDAGYQYSAKSSPIIFLINFDGVKNIINDLIAAKFDVIIVDESTKIKSPQTLRTKVLWTLGKGTKHKMILTGFPITEALYDLYAQIKFLDNGETLGKSYYGFMDTYFVKYGAKYVIKRKMLPVLLDKIKPFCIRVTNKTLKLPPQVFTITPIEPTDQQKKLLAELTSLFQLEFGKVKFDTQYIFALIAKSLQICDGFVTDKQGNLEIVDTNKDEVLLDTLEAIDPRKNKVVIWAIYKFTIKKIKRYLEKLGYNVLTLTGDTEDADFLVKQFQHSPKHNILISTQKKGSASITLTNCRYAIYYSNSWSYDERANSEARIYRKGSEKHKSVIYTDFLTKGSIEERIHKCLKGKKSLVDELKQEFTTFK